MGALTGADEGMIQIAPATPENTPEIFAMIHELAEYEKLTHQITGSVDRLRADLFGDRPVIEALVARMDGATCGFALFFYNYSTFLTRPGIYLEDLYVRPDFRGQGAGKALLVHLAGLAMERGAGRFEWSVLDWNEPAIRFYKSMGAEVMPDWRICRVTGEALRTLAGKATAT